MAHVSHDAVDHSLPPYGLVVHVRDDETARDWFVLLHIPLFIAVFWMVFLAPWKRLAGQVLSGLTIVHAIVHFLLSDHQLYTFLPPIETITVYGAALSSAVYLLLSFLETSE